VIVAGITAVLMLLPGRAVVQPLREPDLKAAFVAKVPQFVEWPSSPGGVIDLCVTASEEFSAALRTFVDGDVANERGMVVREISPLESIEGCDLLFISGTGAQEGRALLAAAGSLPILTVGDSLTVMDDGGMIGLRMVDGQVRFEVNPDAAANAGLRISAQLLRLALAIRGRR
jgi:YfiR/HmsC-like